MQVSNQCSHWVGSALQWHLASRESPLRRGLPDTLIAGV